MGQKNDELSMDVTDFRDGLSDQGPASSCVCHHFIFHNSEEFAVGAIVFPLYAAGCFGPSLVPPFLLPSLPATSLPSSYLVIPL